MILELLGFLSEFSDNPFCLVFVKLKDQECSEKRSLSDLIYESSISSQCNGN